MGKPTIHTLGELKKSGYAFISIKDEMRKNLIAAIQEKRNIFEGIIGFEDTVIPDVERAILSRHNILFLGLRGQAKTRIARILTRLLDEYIPIISGSEINDDPLFPLSIKAIDLVKEHGDNTPISWLHRDDRYVEKLATPDVSIADLIGDVDPIKAATLKLPYSDQRVIHFGLIPRANRSLFVINELPDLQARIQVSLFNILQEGDLQIRGFKFRLPLDIQFIFTANPEDYTNRGSIVTPLKDRIESQILTHYPKDIEISKKITEQESNILEAQKTNIHVPNEIKYLLEGISFNARESEYVDEKSGISARMTISAFENLISTAERRMLINGEKNTAVRITDLWGTIPSLTGKMELVYEGEQEGPYAVALDIMSQSIKEKFLHYFKNPDKPTEETADPYAALKYWFSDGNIVDLMNDDSDEVYRSNLNAVPGLSKIVEHIQAKEEDKYFFMELALHGLSEFEVLTKTTMDKQLIFKDPLAGMLDDLE